MAHISRVVQQLKKELERAVNEVSRFRAALVALGSKSGARRGLGQRRTLSAAARRKISLAQKARWSRLKSGAQPTTPKRAASAASRRKMAAAQRRRWSKVKKNKVAA